MYFAPIWVDFTLSGFFAIMEGVVVPKGENLDRGCRQITIGLTQNRSSKAHRCRQYNQYDKAGNAAGAVLRKS